MFAKGVVGHFAANERIAHLQRSISDAVGSRNRILGLNEPQFELSVFETDAALQLRVDRINLGGYTEITLAVAFRPHNTDGGFVNECGVRVQFTGDADGLHRTSRVSVNQYDVITHSICIFVLLA